METKGIETDLEDRKLQWKGFEALSFLRALKIAVGFRKIYRKLFFSSVQEFLWSIRFDCTCHNECARLYFEIWKRVTKQEMDFYRALRQIHEQNICPLFSVLMEPELKYEENPKNHSPKPGSIKNTYDTFLAEIPADATEHLAQQLIKDAVKKIVPKQKAYYDYIKKKLEVAEKIQLIPCESQSTTDRYLGLEPPTQVKHKSTSS
ncbi:uncharacterized protein [Miscanthus floridulus]|uniref:uncharacterized protein isoform X2 n=1 Tax=Miscanthus floridulus TaxID=154761 RepID=UPI0034599FAB